MMTGIKTDERKGSKLMEAMEHFSDPGNREMVLPTDEWEKLHDELLAYHAKRKPVAEMKVLNIIHMPGPDVRGQPPHHYPAQPMPYFLIKQRPVFCKA